MIDYTELAEYVEAAKNNDEKAFNYLYEKTWGLVYSMACSMLKDNEEARDVVQEVYIKVYTKIKSLSDNRSFIRWLNVITSNTCNDHLTERGKTAENKNITDLSGEPDDSPSIEERIQNRWESSIIADMVNSLPVPQKRAVYLYYYQQMTVSQIAEIENCAENTIKSRLYYARNTLKKEIEAENLI